MARIGGNPDIGEIAKTKSTGPKTEIGKWKASTVRGSKKNIVNAKYDKTPPEVRELWAWFKEIKTKEIETLIELKNLYNVVKSGLYNKLMEKVVGGEDLTRKDLDHIKLVKDTLVDLHKLKYGDRKVIEHKVDIKDIRRAIFSSNPKKVIEVNADGKISQDMGGSGHGQDREQDRETGTSDRSSEGMSGSD